MPPPTPQHLQCAVVLLLLLHVCVRACLSPDWREAAHQLPDLPRDTVLPLLPMSFGKVSGDCALDISLGVDDRGRCTVWNSIHDLHCNSSCHCTGYFKPDPKPSPRLVLCSTTCTVSNPLTIASLWRHSWLWSFLPVLTLSPPEPLPLAPFQVHLDMYYIDPIFKVGFSRFEGCDELEGVEDMTNSTSAVINTVYRRGAKLPNGVWGMCIGYSDSLGSRWTSVDWESFWVREEGSAVNFSFLAPDPSWEDQAFPVEVTMEGIDAVEFGISPSGDSHPWCSRTIPMGRVVSSTGNGVVVHLNFTVRSVFSGVPYTTLCFRAVTGGFWHYASPGAFPVRECRPGRWLRGLQCEDCPGEGTPCSGHGVCDDGRGGSGLCMCYGRWFGAGCSLFPTLTPTLSPTSSLSWSATASPTATVPSTTLSRSLSRSLTLTPSNTPFPTPSSTSSSTVTATTSATASLTPTLTHSVTQTPTSTIPTCWDGDEPCTCQGAVDGALCGEHTLHRVQVCSAGRCVVRSRCLVGVLVSGCTCRVAEDGAECIDGEGRCRAKQCLPLPPCTVPDFTVQCSCRSAPSGARCGVDMHCSHLGVCTADDTPTATDSASKSRSASPTATVSPSVTQSSTPTTPTCRGHNLPCTCQGADNDVLCGTLHTGVGHLLVKVCRGGSCFAVRRCVDGVLLHGCSCAGANDGSTCTDGLEDTVDECREGTCRSTRRCTREYEGPCTCQGAPQSSKCGPRSACDASEHCTPLADSSIQLAAFQLPPPQGATSAEVVVVVVNMAQAPHTVVVKLTGAGVPGEDFVVESVPEECGDGRQGEGQVIECLVTVQKVQNTSVKVAVRPLWGERVSVVASVHSDGFGMWRDDQHRAEVVARIPLADVSATVHHTAGFGFAMTIANGGPSAAGDVRAKVVIHGGWLRASLAFPRELGPGERVTQQLGVAPLNGTYLYVRVTVTVTALAGDPFLSNNQDSAGSPLLRLPPPLLPLSRALPPVVRLTPPQPSPKPSPPLHFSTTAAVLACAAFPFFVLNLIPMRGGGGSTWLSSTPS